MALRRCLDGPEWALPGKPRCATHQRAKSRERGTTSQRGYGWQHQQRRAQDMGATTLADPCPKCGLPLGPPPWDQGHTDDRTDWEGPTHPACNRATARRQP